MVKTPKSEMIKDGLTSTKFVKMEFVEIMVQIVDQAVLPKYVEERVMKIITAKTVTMILIQMPIPPKWKRMRGFAFFRRNAKENEYTEVAKELECLRDACITVGVPWAL